MGYPMTWDRVLNRNSLCGNYSRVRSAGGTDNEYGHDRPIMQEELFQRLRMISGDMRRVERDCMEDVAGEGGYSYHRRLCEYAGVDSSTLRRVLNAFFTDCGSMPLPAITIHDEGNK